jgi:hypothetical protein
MGAFVTSWRDDPFQEIPAPCPFCGQALAREVDDEGAYFVHPPHVKNWGASALSNRAACIMGDTVLVDGSADLARWNQRPSIWTRIRVWWAER